ncbi:MAG: membrane protein insertion efficiency factor YidD [Alphaproteobacteria bacterium]
MSAASVTGRVASRMACILLSLPIRLYRYAISPLLPMSCRYLPTCSDYALDALKLHGPVRGTALAIRRIVRCHPWGGHGLDPVPPAGHTHGHRHPTDHTPEHCGQR